MLSAGALHREGIFQGMGHRLFTQYMGTCSGAFLGDAAMRAGRRQHANDVRSGSVKKLRAGLEGRQTELRGNLRTPLRAWLGDAYDFNAVQPQVCLDVRLRNRPRPYDSQGAPLPFKNNSRSPP